MSEGQFKKYGFFLNLFGFVLFAGYIIIFRPRDFARFSYVMSRYFEYEEMRKHLPCYRSPP